MLVILSVAAGGALGSLLRLATNLGLRRWGGEFPWGTLAVNVLGSLLIGMVWAWMLTRPQAPEWLRLGVMTGVLGGYTTFSALALESVLLAESGAWLTAAASLAGNVFLGVLACVAGVALARALLAA